MQGIYHLKSYEYCLISAKKALKLLSAPWAPTWLLMGAFGTNWRKFVYTTMFSINNTLKFTVTFSMDVKSMILYFISISHKPYHFYIIVELSKVETYCDHRHSHMHISLKLILNWFLIYRKKWAIFMIVMISSTFDLQPRKPKI